MQKLIKVIIYVFLLITSLTAILSLSGIAYIWFVSDKGDLLYLKWLIGSVLLEIISIVIILSKKGLKYLPDVKVNKNSNETLKFMEEFITLGTTATIVSNRVSWLSSSENLIQILTGKIDQGLRIEIITKEIVSQDVKDKLKGAYFYETNDTVAPEARFTLVNGDRAGAEKLAIAKGVHPEHEITVFDYNTGPQIIAMAKDIIRKSKELSNVEKMV